MSEKCCNSCKFHIRFLYLSQVFTFLALIVCYLSSYFPVAFESDRQLPHRNIYAETNDDSHKVVSNMRPLPPVRRRSHTIRKRELNKDFNIIVNPNAPYLLIPSYSHVPVSTTSLLVCSVLLKEVNFWFISVERTTTFLLRSNRLLFKQYLASNSRTTTASRTTRLGIF